MKRKLVLQSLKKVLLIIPFIFALSLSDIFFSSVQGGRLSTALWYGIFGQVTSGDVRTLVMSMESLGCIFLFSLLFGTYISCFFGSTSIFWFTRLSSRRSWVSRQILRLCGMSALYTIILLGLKFLISVRRIAAWSMDDSIVFILFTLFFTLSLLFAIVCLLTNWAAIKHGISVGLVAVAAFVLLLELIAILFFDNSINIILNPLCFNIDIIRSVSLACAKISAEIFYLLALSVGMVTYINRMDIF